MRTIKIYFEEGTAHLSRAGRVAALITLLFILLLSVALIVGLVVQGAPEINTL